MEPNNKGSSPFTVGCLTIVISFVLIIGIMVTLGHCKALKNSGAGDMLMALFTNIVIFSILYSLFADPRK
jgi:hypothetical protein